MMRGRRPRDPIWEFFFQVEDGGKTYAKWKNCSKQQTVKAQRMREHHKKCGFGHAAIDRAQSDSAGLADTCDIFLDLLEDQILKPHQKEVEKRFKQAIHAAMSSDCLHVASYLSRQASDN